eukprot:jgi/Galph1/2844/GphlegSOOS_G1548.1
MHAFVNTSLIRTPLIVSLGKKPRICSDKRLLVKVRSITPRMSLETLATESLKQFSYAPLLLSSESGGMVVQEGGYLAVLLGILFPVAFLIILYIQSEARNAGMKQD